MARRPLYGVAFLFLLFCLFAAPFLRMPYDIREGDGTLVGTVDRREQKDGRQIYYLKDTNISKTGRILVYLNQSNGQYLIGNTLKVDGTIKKYEEATNPGQFDSRTYYATQKIYGMCYGRHVEVLDDSVLVFREWLHNLRLRMGEEIEGRISQKNAGVLKAMLLGERQAMDQKVKDLYQISGIAHLLSISGLHISILGMGIYRSLRRVGLPYWAAGIPAVIFMGAYGVMIGAGASTLRALTMFFLTVGADLLGRSYDLRTALAVAAIWLLAEQPLYAGDPGFLLSFGAVWALTEVDPTLKWLLQRRKDSGSGGHSLLRRVCQGLHTTVSIQIVTLPVLMSSFFEVALYAPLLNLLAVPLMPPLLMLGILCCGLGIWSGWAPLPGWLEGLLDGLARIAGWCSEGILWLTEQSARGVSALPGAVYCTGEPRMWQTAVYYVGTAAILAVLWWRRKWEENRTQTPGGRAEKREGTGEKQVRGLGWRLWIFCGSGYFLLLSVLLFRFDQPFAMTMLDVGQGDGIYFAVRGGSSFLVDGGSSDEKQVGAYRLEPFLKSQGRDHIDYVLISHGDEDHVSGVREILEGELLPVEHLILPMSGREEQTCLALAALAGERGTEVLWMKQGDCLQEGKLTIRCLGPESGAWYSSTNAGSLVLRVTYGELNILLTGDLEAEGERGVRKSRWLEACDILKVAHHGSAYSTDAAWLEAVKPRVSLISCGEDNAYGHPHRELLERLEQAGSRVYRTDLGGAVIVTSDGKQYKVRTWR